MAVSRFILVFSLLAVGSGPTDHHTGIARQTYQDLEGRYMSQSGTHKAANKFDPLKYLPAGASLSNPEKNVVFADLIGDGKQEVVIFYRILDGDKHQANILVLKPTTAGYERLWEDVHDLGSGFADPSGVYDLNKNARPQIVAYRIVGASCPGVLDIFQYANGKIEKITGDWVHTCQSDLEIKDLNGDGVSEIIFRPLKYGVNRRIYSWSGKEYVRTDNQHAHYFSDELQQLVGGLYEHRALPTPSRAVWCEQAVRIYLLQGRYIEAIALCRAVLPMIDDPELTIPNSGATTPAQQNRVLAFFELDKVKDKARVYRLLADAFKAAGKLQSAKNYSSEARKLNAEAAEKESRLPY
ncbi:MAG TPA: hypothetical protein VNS63_00595 [Blastocatellia bacterium]|nr:hypothetical protein [Blastocatellia bacterium]